MEYFARRSSTNSNHLMHNPDKKQHGNIGILCAYFELDDIDTQKNVEIHKSSNSSDREIPRCFSYPAFSRVGCWNRFTDPNSMIFRRWYLRHSWLSDFVHFYQRRRNPGMQHRTHKRFLRETRPKLNNLKIDSRTYKFRKYAGLCFSMIVEVNPAPAVAKKQNSEPNMFIHGFL